MPRGRSARGFVLPLCLLPAHEGRWPGDSSCTARRSPSPSPSPGLCGAVSGGAGQLGASERHDRRRRGRPWAAPRSGPRRCRRSLPRARARAALTPPHRQPAAPRAGAGRGQRRVRPGGDPLTRTLAETLLSGDTWTRSAEPPERPRGAAGLEQARDCLTGKSSPQFFLSQ